MRISSFFVPGILLLCGCADLPEEEGKETSSAEARHEFFSEFAERTTAVGKGFLNVRGDGSLRYEEQQNPHCIFEFLGRIEVINNKDKNTYSITYRYNSLNTAHRACRPNDSRCGADFTACQQAATKASAELGKLKRQEIARGSSASVLRLVP